MLVLHAGAAVAAQEPALLKLTRQALHSKMLPMLMPATAMTLQMRWPVTCRTSALMLVAAVPAGAPAELLLGQGSMSAPARVRVQAGAAASASK